MGSVSRLVLVFLLSFLLVVLTLLFLLLLLLCASPLLSSPPILPTSLAYAPLLPLRSPHNTRIERLWPDMTRLVGAGWYTFFMYLQTNLHLDKTLSSHKWLLAFLFLDDINADLTAYQAQHNSHSVSTEGNRSPNQLFFKGMMVNGVRGFPDGEASVDEWSFGTQGRLLDRELAERMASEVRNEVTVEDPRCPFLHPEVSVGVMRARMIDQWFADRSERFQAGMAVMQDLLLEEEP